MKKILSIFISAAILASLASCSAQETAENDPTEMPSKSFSGTPLYTEAASAFSYENGIVTVKPPSEEFLINVFSLDSSRVIFSIDSSGTYLSFMEGMLYEYSNDDKQFIYNAVSEKFDESYFEENKEHIQEVDNVSTYDEYIKLIENFYSGDWMQIYQEYDPDDPDESFVHFHILPERHGYGFCGENTDYSEEEVFLKTIEWTFENINKYNYFSGAMASRIESGENYYVNVEAEYKGDNIVRVHSWFAETCADIVSAPYKDGEYFTMDGSELPEEYKD